jgi:CspA family cold shock protein
MSLKSGDIIRGTVKRFNPKRGFGFIQMTGETNDEDDVFIHQSDIDIEGFRSLNVDEEVEFTLEITETNELKARHCRLISVRSPNSQSGGGYPQQSRPAPLVDAGQRALVRAERIECQMKKLIEILAKDVDGDVVLTAQDIQDIYTAQPSR